MQHSPTELQFLKEAFDRIDINKNGLVEVAELEKMLIECGIKAGLEAKTFAQHEVDRSDENLDGRVSFEEFVKHMAHYVVGDDEIGN